MIRRAARLCLAFAIAGAAAPALAQSGVIHHHAIDQAELNLLRAQQAQAARDAVIQQNDIFRLENQMRTQQTIDALHAQSLTPQLPPPPASGAIPHVDVSGLASIPDDRLAASNARVQEAAGNRR